MQKSGAEIIVTLLERQGIQTVTGIPGGANLPLYDALRTSRIRHILARHEQGAGFIAQGMARATGKAAVCLGTSGPGTTNLLTAIADAKLDSIPLIAITGQVPIALRGTNAFQEVDTPRLTLPITKHTFSVQRANELIDLIPRAFEIAESGRPGPVVIDVPKDVQTQKVSFHAWPHPWVHSRQNTCDPNGIQRLAKMIGASSQPVLYIGGGIIASAAEKELFTFAKKSSIPVTATLSGLGGFPADDPQFLGMLGMHGARYTNLVLDQADLVLAFGVRFDDRATGRAETFCSRAAIAHIDIDPSEINKIKPADLSIVGDAGQVLRSLIPMICPRKRTIWNRKVTELKNEYPLPDPKTSDPFHPINLIKQLGNIIGPDTIITTDVGQHQMWVAQAYSFQKPRTFLSSGGLGTMGFGIPAAIGAALSRPHSHVVCISGDGSLLMNIQELSTLAELDLHLTIIIMNNRNLGLVRQQQELFYGSRYYASQFGKPPDFITIARGFGIRAIDLADAQNPIAILKDTIQTAGPTLINVPVNYEENVYPMVPPGSGNQEMIEPEVVRNGFVEANRLEKRVSTVTN